MLDKADPGRGATANLLLVGSTFGGVCLSAIAIAVSSSKPNLLQPGSTFSWSTFSEVRVQGSR